MKPVGDGDAKDIGYSVAGDTRNVIFIFNKKTSITILNSQTCLLQVDSNIIYNLRIKKIGCEIKIQFLA
mgnify:CR=1 FL=1